MRNLRTAAMDRKDMRARMAKLEADNAKLRRKLAAADDAEDVEYDALAFASTLEWFLDATAGLRADGLAAVRSRAEFLLAEFGGTARGPAAERMGKLERLLRHALPHLPTNLKGDVETAIAEE